MFECRFKKVACGFKICQKKKKKLFILSLPEHWYSQKHYFNEVFTCHWMFSLCSRVVSLMCRLNLSSHRGSSHSVNSVSFADPIMCHNSRVKIALHKYSSSIFQVFTFHSTAVWPCLPLFFWIIITAEQPIWTKKAFARLKYPDSTGCVDCHWDKLQPIAIYSCGH